MFEMRYRLRSLFLLAAVGPPLLAAAWFVVQSEDVLLAAAAFATLLLLVGIPVALAMALFERRRYLIDKDRRERRRSGLFRDRWPTSE
jgi:hypothetical protein